VSVRAISARVKKVDARSDWHRDGCTSNSASNQLNRNIQCELGPNPVRGPCRGMTALGKRKTGSISQRQRPANHGICGCGFRIRPSKWNQLYAGEGSCQFLRGHPIVVALGPSQNLAPVHRTNGDFHIRAELYRVKESLDSFPSRLALNHRQNGCGIQNDTIHVLLPRAFPRGTRPEFRREFRAS